jgi:hypothetical protein
VKPIAYDGVSFRDLGCDGSFVVSSFTGPSVSPVAITREGLDPIHAGTIRGVRTVTIAFHLGQAENDNGDIVKTGDDVIHARMRLLGALRVGEPDDRVLVARIPGDGPNEGNEVEIRAATGQYRYGNESAAVLYVDFTIADDRWIERAAITLPDTDVTAARAIPLPNTGGAPAKPTYRIAPAAQRVTFSPDIGWRYRRQHTITNEGTENWYRVRVTLDLGDTAAWVTAGKALATGDDVRVRIAGQPSSQELPRTLTNFNTPRTWLHTFVTIPAGESLTLDVIYGNPDATAPPYTLSTRTRTQLTYAADDLEGYTSTVTSGTTTTLTKTGAGWEVNRWANGHFYLPATGRAGRIASNTADTITFNRALSSSPTAGHTFLLWKSGVFFDGGRVSSVSSSTTFADSLMATNWTTNQLKGGTITFVTGTANPATSVIASNTLTNITIEGTWSVNPTVGDSYRIERAGHFDWMVNPDVEDTLHRGLWRINKYNTKGSGVWYGDLVPGGWLPWLMLQNQDDFAQARYVDEGGGTVENYPLLYARRAVRSDNTWSEEGQADGVMFYDPRGINGMYADYRIRNNNGVGQYVILTQEPEGDDWQTAQTDSATYSTLTDVAASGENFTGDTVPNKVYLGVLPADGVEIPSTVKKSDRVEARTGDVLRMWLDLTDVGGLVNSLHTVGSEANIYDLHAILRVGGGIDADPPYDQIAVDTLLALTGEELRIATDPDADAPLFGRYSTAGALLARVPWAATIQRRMLDADGNGVWIVSRSLAPIPPRINLVGASEDRITGWTFTSGGTTATLANEASVVYDGDGEAFKVVFTAAPVGAWTAYVELDDAIALIPGALYEFGAAVRTTLAGLTIAIESNWMGGASTPDPLTSAIIASPATGAWFPLGSGRTVFAGDDTDDPTDSTDLRLRISGTGTVNGTVYFDAVHFGATNLYVSEEEIGELEVGVTYERGWIA